MSEVSFQNNIAKVSAVKDGIQSQSTKKSDSTFKSILEGVSSENSSAGKKSLDTAKKDVNDNKAEAMNSDKVKVVNDIKTEAVNSDKAKVINDREPKAINSNEAKSMKDCKQETANNNTNEVLHHNTEEVVNDSEASIKLSSKELAQLEAFIAKLSSLSNDKIATEDKPKLNLDDAVELFKMNLVKISNALAVLKSKDTSAVDGNNEVQPSKANLDLIDELSKMQNQIADMISILNTANTSADTQVNDETKDSLNDYMSEHSMNTEKKDTKASDILLELCGMASILSQVAVIKVEQLENVDNKTEVQTNEPLKEVQALNKSLTTIKELLVNSSQISPETKKDYSNLAQIAESTITSKNNNVVVAVDKLKLKEIPESKQAVSNMLKILTNNNENLEVDSKTGSEIEKLLNKFVEKANELGQKLKLSNEVSNNQLVKDPIQNAASVIDDITSKTTKKLTNEVRRKLENGDAVFDKGQNKFVIFEEKPDTSFKKVVETQNGTPTSGEKTNSSSLDKEDKLLLKLASEDKDSSKDDMSSKIARVTNLATSLNTEKSLPVELSEKIPVVNRQTFNSDLIKSLKYMELNDVKELTVKIMPKELGELFIKITREGEVVKAQITATNKEAYNVLNSNLSDITKQLSEQNIKIHSFNVEIFNGDSSFYNQGSNNENGNSQSKRKNSFGNFEIDEVDNSEDTLKEFNNVNALA